MAPFDARGSLRASRGRVALQLSVIALAAVVAVVPLPAELVERYYSDWFYPALQARLTSWSNETGVALFDFILIFQILLIVIVLWRSIAAAVRKRSIGRFFAGLLTIATVLAVTYLWVEAAWGLNYSRVPLENAVGYDQRRVTPSAVRALAERAVAETNRSYGAGHAAGFPATGEVPPSLVSAFHEVERRLGRVRPMTPGRPKRTLLGAFFRASGTDGMHAPLMLETLLNPDLTPPERPAVLAHEWAHLSGYAPEDDASFVGLLAALRADPGSRYSAWLSLVADATSQLPRAERQDVISRLDPGPLKDEEAIAVRLRSRVEVVQRASWETYDKYLKAQGVQEGVRNYSRVVQLLIGSAALDW